jgi:hypothetical protein
LWRDISEEESQTALSDSDDGSDDKVVPYDPGDGIFHPDGSFGPCRLDPSASGWSQQTGQSQEGSLPSAPHGCEKGDGQKALRSRKFFDPNPKGGGQI